MSSVQVIEDSDLSTSHGRLTHTKCLLQSILSLFPSDVVLKSLELDSLFLFTWRILKIDVKSEGLPQKKATQGRPDWAGFVLRWLASKVSLWTECALYAFSMSKPCLSTQPPLPASRAPRRKTAALVPSALRKTRSQRAASLSWKSVWDLRYMHCLQRVLLRL